MTFQTGCANTFFSPLQLLDVCYSDARMHVMHGCLEFMALVVTDYLPKPTLP